jgi:3'-phosphoadenosine 5'-phosphosulfate sulfotransferase (PAPS reductase)/FAD synthetase
LRLLFNREQPCRFLSAVALLLTALHREKAYTGDLELCHCDMGRSEWSFTREYVRQRAKNLNVPLAIVRNPRRDLLDLFRQRSVKRPDVPLWPSAAHRYCTSEKVAQIDAHLRKWAGKTGKVISAIGIRAAESPARARKPVYCQRESITTRTRQDFTWSPIHHLSTEETWEVLDVSQADLHKAR